MLAPPEREDFSRRGGASLRWVGVLYPHFSALPARRRNVGFCTAAAHTLAVGAESRTQRRHAAHDGERCLLWKGARMQTVQGVTPLPSCSGKRQSHWSARRSERMPRFRFAIFSVRSEMPSCFASARTSSAGLGLSLIHIEMCIRDSAVLEALGENEMFASAEAVMPGVLNLKISDE